MKKFAPLLLVGFIVIMLFFAPQSPFSFMSGGSSIDVPYGGSVDIQNSFYGPPSSDCAYYFSWERYVNGRYDGAGRGDISPMASSPVQIYFNPNVTSNESILFTWNLENQCSRQIVESGSISYNVNCKTFSNPDPLIGVEFKDSDGDGLVDNLDACPVQYGLPSNAGCPKTDPQPSVVPVVVDTDGDGVPDSSDLCPNEYGTDSRGCPLVPVDIDTDGDGIFDSADSCDNVSGPPSNAGCPVDLTGTACNVESVLFETTREPFQNSDYRVGIYDGSIGPIVKRELYQDDYLIWSGTSNGFGTRYQAVSPTGPTVFRYDVWSNNCMSSALLVVDITDVSAPSGFSITDLGNGGYSFYLIGGVALLFILILFGKIRIPL